MRGSHAALPAHIPNTKGCTMATVVSHTMRVKLLHFCRSVDGSWIHLNRGKLNLQAAQVCVSRGAVDICSERLWLVLLRAEFSSCNLNTTCGPSWGSAMAGLGREAQGVLNPLSALHVGVYTPLRSHWGGWDLDMTSSCGYMSR